MNVYDTFTSKPGHFLTVKIWENIIKYFVSTVCFPPEVDLHHPSLWLSLAQLVAIQTYFYNWKVLLTCHLHYGRKYGMLWLIFYFVFVFILSYFIFYYYYFFMAENMARYDYFFILYLFLFYFIYYYYFFLTRCCLSLFSFSCSWMSRRVASATGQNVTGTLGLGAVEQSGKQNRQDLKQHLLHFRLTELSVKMNAGLLSINSPRSVHQAQFAWEWATLKN